MRRISALAAAVAATLVAGVATVAAGLWTRSVLGAMGAGALALYLGLGAEALL